MMLRLWEERDIEAVAALEAACIRCPWTEDMLREEFHNPAYRCVVCEDEGEVRGYAGWWTVADWFEISNVAVDAAFQRRGIARALLGWVLEAAERENLAVTLEVARGNEAALALYRAAGFREEGVRRSYYGPGEDALILWRRRGTGDPDTAENG